MSERGGQDASSGKREERKKRGVRVGDEEKGGLRMEAAERGRNKGRQRERAEKCWLTLALAPGTQVCQVVGFTLEPEGFDMKRRYRLESPAESCGGGWRRRGNGVGRIRDE